LQSVPPSNLLFILVSLLIVFTGCGARLIDETGYIGEWRTAGGDFERSGSIHAELSPPLIEAWRTKAGRGFKGSPVPVGAIVIAATTDGMVKAYLARDGKKLWQTKIGGGCYGDPVVSSGRIFVTTEYPDGSLYAIDIRRGEEIWNRKIGPSRSTPTIDAGIIYTLSDEGTLFAHTITRGELLWKRQLRAMVPQSPIIIGDSLFIVASKDTMDVLSTIDGKIINHRAISPNSFPSTAAMDGCLFYGWAGGIGLITLRHPEGRMEVSNAPRTYKLSISGDTILGTDGIRAAFAWGPHSGKLLWRRTTSGLLEAAPVTSGKAVIILSLAGEIVMVDVGSGELLWKETVAAPLYAAPAISGRRLFITTGRGELIAFAAEDDLDRTGGAR